jgi:predicted dehydrogenase
MNEPGRIRVGQVGLGYWGPNLARNFDLLGDLRWLCDLDEEQLAAIGRRLPNAQLTTEYDDLLNDPEVDAIVVATPVPTHALLAKQALEAGKHVFVEKPLAMNAADAEELVALAAERDLVLMPGHLLIYHPAVRKLKELAQSGDLGDIRYVYGNRQNHGKIRTNENAMWSLGVHDLSVILYLIDEEPSEVYAHGNAFLNEGVEDVVFCYLRFPSGKIAHMHLSWLDPHKMRKMTVVGSKKMVVFDDMELERKITIFDKSEAKPATTYGEWQTRTGDIYIPKIPTDEPLRLECDYFLSLVRGEGDRAQVAQDGLVVVRALERLQSSLGTVAAGVEHERRSLR